jgi:hypothetical protein
MQESINAPHSASGFLPPRKARRRKSTKREILWIEERKDNCRRNVMKNRKKSYSVLIASTGQDLAHLPHPVHFSLSTTAVPSSPIDTAPAGH